MDERYLGAWQAFRRLTWWWEICVILILIGQVLSPNGELTFLRLGTWFQIWCLHQDRIKSCISMASTFATLLSRKIVKLYTKGSLGNCLSPPFPPLSFQLEKTWFFCHLHRLGTWADYLPPNFVISDLSFSTILRGPSSQFHMVVFVPYPVFLPPG